MNKPYVHSYTGIKEFETCPRRFKATKILKLYPYEETEATRYGNEVHKALEDYVNSKTPIPKKHEQFKPVVDALLAKPGRAVAEMAFGVRRDLSPCDFFDKKVWLRGKADIVILDDDNFKAVVGDYKTGKNKYPDLDQMTFMSMFVFAHFSHIRQVNSGLIFLLYNDLKKQRMVVEDVEKTWWKIKERTARIEAAIEADQFPPKPGPLCGWCPHSKGCEHHPKH
jgi:CRISPR/Cas system-associated exonuclease Cas4 (RecB family)